MNIRFNNRTHSMYVNFALDENGNDRIRIGSTPRNSTGAYDTEKGVTVTLYKNSFKTTKDGSPNYRNVEVFYKAIVDMVKQYKDNPNTTVTQFSSSYINSVTGHKMQYGFGITDKEGIASYVLYFNESFNDATKKSIYRFKDEEELERFTDQLKLFCDDWVQMTSHLIYSEMNNIISKAVGEQLAQVVKEEFFNQYPELSNVISKAIQQKLSEIQAVKN